MNSGLYTCGYSVKDIRRIRNLPEEESSYDQDEYCMYKLNGRDQFIKKWAIQTDCQWHFNHLNAPAVVDTWYNVSFMAFSIAALIHLNVIILPISFTFAGIVSVFKKLRKKSKIHFKT
ncbi:hypothetical protein A2Z22_03595 [Candidatus Woesebacteria bacterium RBG_16_34_12]|uniref:Uncharacterized protein n=1 Tax=Candidatus Woesebacteria bacterium RBG_16_34_12 TaxID=1802480 RepID=A0A1F7XAV7_9BACT|nr:MAG: hypothetical protein A2Z22_03595 [Candidatus Woesebacteria bacterium RBG_16_34_12]